jgi:hypothetical protein
MILQDRDRKLLFSLSKYGVLSTEQIANTFFVGVAHTTVMRRLRKLESESVILRLKGLPFAQSAWCLTVTGARRIEVQEPQRYSNQNVILHEVTLSGLRMCLEKINLGSDWISESDIRKDFTYSRTYNNTREQIIPDGVFVAKDISSGIVAVELELTPKSHARYRKILSQYALKDSIKWLWYVVSKKSIAITVLNQWLRVRRFTNSPILMYSVLEDLFCNLEKANVHIADGRNKHLDQVFDIPPLLSKSTSIADLSDHRVSKLSENSLSNQLEKQVEENQKLITVSKTLTSTPSTLGPSPSTIDGKGPRLTG